MWWIPNLLACVAPVEPGVVHDSGDTPPIAPLPPNLPAWTVTSSDASVVADGYVLLSLVSETRSLVGIVDGGGRWVWAVEAPPDQTLASPRLGLDGASILYASYPRDRRADTGGIVRVDLGGRHATTPTTTAHHMFTEQGDGTFAWLSLEGREIPVSGGVAPILADRILVGPEGPDAVAPDTRFSFFDLTEPYAPCEHATIPIDRFAWTGYFEWTHSNSLVRLPDDGSWILASRHLDAVLRIGPAGEVRWQLGGRDATLTVDDPTLLPSHPHLSDAWDDGALVFDNGVHRDPPFTRVVRWSFDAATGTATPTWVYQPADGRYAPMLGDARRLPEDHVLVAWSVLDTLEEVDVEGRAVWTATLTEPYVIGRIGFLDVLP